MKALVTGAAGGIGRALVARLAAESYDVLELDLTTGFDVTKAEHWDAIGPVDVACLNAGVLTNEGDIAELTDEQYRRALGVNVDGVVFGTRRLAQVLEPGSAIVVTASLAGLMDMESDAIYSLTKHAVVGFVRSVAPQLETKGIRINMVNPGIVDTPMTAHQRHAFEAAGFPLMQPEQVADAVWVAATSEETGQSWVCQPGREPLRFRFPRVPGPRGPGAEGAVPPLR